MASAPESDSDPQSVQSILANLSSEIGRPLEILRQGIDSLLAGADQPPTESEHAQAMTMLTLCDEIDRLTRQFLGTPSKRDG